MSDERWLEERLRAESAAVPLPPRARWFPRPRRSSSIVPALAAAAVVIVLAVAVGTGLRSLREDRLPVATAPVSPTQSASTSAAPSCPPASLPPSPVPTGPPAGGIEAYPLGALCGEYAFVLNGGAITMTQGAVAEIWAVPLAGGQPRLAVRYANAAALAGTARGDNLLAQQFSPDGRRVVLSVVTPRPPRGERLSLFVVELETGRTRMLRSDDADNDMEAWSPDGGRIAYVRKSPGTQDDGIWLVNADGSGARRAIPAARGGLGAASHLWGWTSDGRLAWSYTSSPLTLTDITSGAETHIGPFVGDARGLSFRSAAPRLAGSFTDTQNCPGTFVLIGDGAPERTLVGEPNRGKCSQWHRNVRWNPTRDEVLYIREGSGGSELHIHELSGVTQRVAPQAEVVFAEWSAAGTHLVYVHRDAQLQRQDNPRRGTELRYARRDGGDERVIFTPRGPASLSDLAVRFYPSRS